MKFHVGDKVKFILKKDLIPYGSLGIVVLDREPLIEQGVNVFFPDMLPMLYATWVVGKSDIKLIKKAKKK